MAPGTGRRWRLPKWCGGTPTSSVPLPAFLPACLNLSYMRMTLTISVPPMLRRDVSRAAKVQRVSESELARRTGAHSRGMAANSPVLDGTTRKSMFSRKSSATVARATRPPRSATRPTERLPGKVRIARCDCRIFHAEEFDSRTLPGSRCHDSICA